MPLVENVTGFFSGWQPALKRVHALELADTPLGQGTFGKVYACVAVNGAPPAPQLVVKIFGDNGNARKGMESIRKLQERILECNGRRALRSQPPVDSLPALRALPQLSFLGSMDGHQVLGYVAARLDTDGYRSFETILEDDDHRIEFFSLCLEDRLMLAAELAEGFQVLASELTFIHADLNPPNLFVDVAACRLAIIDYDSGAVMDGPDDRPTTFGKPGQWMAPELEDEMGARGTDWAIVRVSLLTDAWAVFECIHNLLFPVDPFFFAAYATRQLVSDYLDRFRWPAVDLDDRFCNAEAEELYRAYRQELDSLPKLLVDKLKATVNGGYLQPVLRPSCQQWAMVLRAVQSPPRILRFAADPESVVAGMHTQLAWKVSGAREVSIDQGIGAVAAEGSLEIQPADHRRYTLTVRGRNGDVVRRFATVRVWPVPTLRSLAVPAYRVDQRVALRALPTAMPPISLLVDLDLSVQVTNPPSPWAPAARLAAARGRAPVALPRRPGYRGRPFHRMYRQLAEELHRHLMGDSR